MLIYSNSLKRYDSKSYFWIIWKIKLLKKYNSINENAITKNRNYLLLISNLLNTILFTKDFFSQAKSLRFISFCLLTKKGGLAVITLKWCNMNLLFNITFFKISYDGKYECGKTYLKCLTYWIWMIKNRTVANHPTNLRTCLCRTPMQTLPVVFSWKSNRPFPI